MSGAEAFIAIGIASNFIQLIEFTATLCSRIREYSSGSGTPKRLVAQADRLADLLTVLRSLEKSSGQSPLDESVLSRCQAQAQELADLLESLKGGSQSRLQNARKALKSLSRSDQLEELQTILDSLVNTLSLQLQADTRSTTKSVENSTIAILNRQLEQTSLLCELKRGATMRIDSKSDVDHSRKVLWLVPIGRNAAFVGRYAVMNELEARLLCVPGSVSTAILCGLGGVGKSQIALEYTYRIRDRSADLSVFWVCASNQARFVESYKRIASECNILGRDDPTLDVLQLVRDWLEARYECKFLMVLDNVDDRKGFFDDSPSSSKALRDYVPQCSHGTILYTTRNRDIGIDLSLDRDPIFVPSMQIEEARSLLGKRIRAQGTDEEQIELLEELVYLPLAIAQAVAFMVKRNKCISEYMKMYRQSESTRVKLLGQRFNYHGREARPLESVVTTWWISFNSINAENHRAADLLGIMSYMDYQDIPFSLLIADDEDEFDFEEAMGLLEAFSLITLDTKRYFCSVHRLVAVAVQGWLAEYANDRNERAALALHIVYDRFPDGFFESWTTCRAYLPHAESVLRYSTAQGDKTVFQERASLLLSMSTYLRMQGQFEASQLAAEESVRLFEILHGREHEDTLDSIASYAYTIHKRGKYHESVALHREVLAGREKVLGYDHRNTLESLNALGSDLQTLGLYKEAETLHRRELSGKKKMLDDNPDSDPRIESDYLIALNNVARVLASQGRYDEAEKIHRDALERSESALGRFHPGSFITRGELAGTVRDQGRLAEAEEMYIALLHDRTGLLGEKHYDTLISLGNLALVKARRGQHKEAEELNKRALEIQMETLGENHPSTINEMHNLACCAFDRAGYEEAENAFRKCLKSQNVALGSTHPHTLNTRRNIAETMRKQEKYDEAEMEDRQTLKICDEMTENRETEMAATLENIGDGFGQQYRYKEAEPARRQELELRTTVGGDKSPKTIACLSKLGIALSSQEKWEEASPIYQRVLEYQSTVLGWEDKETLRTLWNLALSYREPGLFELAERNFTQLLELQNKVFGSTEAICLDTLMQISWVLQQQKKYAESEQSYRKLLKLVAERQGLGKEWSGETMMVLNNLASVLKYQDNVSDEASQMLWTVYETRRRELGPEHSLTMKSLWFLADHSRDQGKEEEAYQLFRRLRKLGHPDLNGGDNEDGRWEDGEEEADQLERQDLESEEHEHDQQGVSTRDTDRDTGISDPNIQIIDHE